MISLYSRTCRDLQGMRTARLGGDESGDDGRHACLDLIRLFSQRCQGFGSSSTMRKP